MQQELLELNDEIEDLEDSYVEAKLDYEYKKAELLLGIDFAAAIGKAKPTVAEKDAYVKLECKAEEERYKYLGVTISSKKRQLEILLKGLSED